jgi:hypothetical protein
MYLISRQQSGVQRHVLPVLTAASPTFGGQTERVAAELVSGTYFRVWWRAGVHYFC